MYIKKHKHEIEFLLFVLIIFLIWWLGKHYNIDVSSFQKPLERIPVFYSGLIYVVLYVTVTLFLFFSKDVFWLMGAVLFGPALSTLFICIAEVINAFILFYLARRLGRAFIEKSVSEKYRHLDDRLGRISFFWLFIFRAAPLIPYRFLDLGAGLTRINFRKYLTAVILGTPFKMFWIQYILYGVGKNIYRNPYLIVEYFQKNRNLTLFSFVYIILIVMVIYKMRAKE